LDEPTSNLDPVTEKKIITTIDRIARSKTVIWITHSLTGLEKMDEILVMEEGTIVERGTHKQLIEAKGEYFLMRNDQKF